MGILPRKIFKLGGSETLFSALVMKYVSEKLTLKMKMANILQVTIIKITDSKINKSIHRLNVSGSTGPVGGWVGGGGGGPPPPPPPPPGPAAPLAPLLATAQTGMILEGLTQTVSMET